VRLNDGQLRALGVLPAHALLISVHPRPGSNMSSYAAPLMVLEDKLLLKCFSYLKANNVLSTAQVFNVLYLFEYLFGCVWNKYIT
jgi:hypothetical protein